MKMAHLLPETILADLSDLFGSKMGIHFSRERWKDMERGIGAAARELGYKDIQACIRGLLTSELSRTQLEILASHLTIGETYFFREPKSFDAIEQQVINHLILKRSGKDQHLRIWSAGCATGEEPYSLAILLCRMIPDISNWNISILATDINPVFLKKASAGVYGKWSFRGVPKWIIDKYFSRTRSDHYQIHPNIKRLVTFKYLNLAEDVFPSLTNGTNGMDLIMCRNVLMYFSTPRAKQVIENLRLALVDGGCLAVSSVEASHILFAAFEPITFQDVTLYRKAGDGINLSSPAINMDFHTTEAEPASHTEMILPTIEKTVLPAVTRETETEKTETDFYEEVAVLSRQGRYTEAVDKLSGILTKMPQDTRAMDLMARALANQGLLAEAVSWCEKAISCNKLDSSFYYLLATIQQECGQIDEAITALKRALYLDPELVLAHFSLGNLARLQGKHSDAGRHFTNALALLDKYQPGDLLPESEGMTVQRLREIIETVRYDREAA